MYVRRNAAAGIEPDLDVKHLSTIGIGAAGEFEPLSEHGICNHGIVIPRGGAPD
jgi:hypothetical protein